MFVCGVLLLVGVCFCLYEARGESSLAVCSVALGVRTIVFGLG